MKVSNAKPEAAPPRAAATTTPPALWRVALAISTTVLLWASAFVGIRATVTHFSPGSLAMTRFAVASVTLGIVAVALRTKLPAMRDWPRLAVVGLLGVTLYNIALNYGSQFMQAGSASFLINTAPIFTAIFATFLLGERFRPIAWAGIAVSFLGIVLIFLGTGRDFSFDAGAFLILVAAVVQSLYFILQKPLFSRYGGFQVVCGAVWFGTAFMLPFSADMVAEIRAAPIDATLIVVYMGIFPGALAFFTWSYALSKINASKAASFLYCVPPTTIVIAWLALGELPTLLSLIGGAVALAGVGIVNILGKRA